MKKKARQETCRRETCQRKSRHSQAQDDESIIIRLLHCLVINAMRGANESRRNAMGSCRAITTLMVPKRGQITELDLSIEVLKISLGRVNLIAISGQLRFQLSSGNGLQPSRRSDRVWNAKITYQGMRSPKKRTPTTHPLRILRTINSIEPNSVMRKNDHPLSRPHLVHSGTRERDCRMQCERNQTSIFGLDDEWYISTDYAMTFSGVTLPYSCKASSRSYAVVEAIKPRFSVGTPTFFGHPGDEDS